MANERDKQSGQQSDQETRTSGQPLGGNKSNTGTGTTMTQGFSSSRTGSAGAAGSEKHGSGGGFVGSEGSGSGEDVEDRDPQQAGFAEQGRGAPNDSGDIERGGERSDNFDSDIEGSSQN